MHEWFWGVTYDSRFQGASSCRQHKKHVSLYNRWLNVRMLETHMQRRQEDCMLRAIAQQVVK